MTPSLRTTDPRAFDALVAERVMGPLNLSPEALSRIHPDNLQPPYYSTKAEDDYRVLEHVRKTWTPERQCRFAEELMKAVRLRRDIEWGTTYTVMFLLFGNGSDCRGYEVGMYAEAALRVVMEKGQ